MNTNSKVVKTKELDSLLMDFHTLTNMKICIYNSKGEEVEYYPERFSSFCSRLREDKDKEALCMECDAKALRLCKETRKAQIYTCHAGLTECVVPVMDALGTIKGFIVIGQMRGAEGDCETPMLVGDTLNGSLSKEFSLLPIVPKDKLAAAVHILEVCAGYELLKKAVEEFEMGLETRIEEYVRKNIAENLCVENLCREFRLSRVELYNVIYRGYRCTPAGYVKARRLDFASELLKTTNLSVNKIASKCGIPDYNYFSKVFKRAFGVSPREYRKRADK